MKRANTKMMKEINKNIIRNCFRTELDSTAAQLSQKTGLSVVTVNALLKEMVETKEVLVGQNIPSNGGRPSTVYKYNDMFRCAAIIFGFTRNDKNYIKILVTNLLGKCIYEEENIFENVNDNSFNDILDILFDKYESIEAIAFGLPGTEENGVITINDYPDIVGDTFLKHYKEKYKVPVIFVNDINAAVNGYYHNKLDNNHTQTVVGLVFNRVHLPGSGIVINGEIHTGKSNFAGEVAYMPIGIDWINLDYYDCEKVCSAIGKLIAMMSCIIAPDYFVVYGDFFNVESEKKIKENANNMLQNHFDANIIVCDGFEEDYKSGMIRASLEILKNSERIF
ncbi:ROK family protein [[Clostridium] dakarense]|uniref:ROK family protein n=1 Tax=Faecalimicrobium dakarense TaxID=1301100 RepID=UPI0004B003F3|nr:ROK family protein [[Clostridium] dakarense]